MSIYEHSSLQKQNTNKQNKKRDFPVNDLLIPIMFSGGVSSKRLIDLNDHFRVIPQ